MIDRETAAPDLPLCCRLILKRLDLEAADREKDGRNSIFLCAAMRGDLRAAIAKAEAR